jgi:hypothetical protein
LIDGQLKWVGARNTQWFLCGPPDAMVVYLAVDGAVPNGLPCLEADLNPEE